ncbi:peroxide stress protein YaaA [Micromonospora sp. CPCC 206060]|uniref:peroxide stress protein YaaA n=1 Tax=Micromonospora sp. CPCC 206060 TaxID=3122406 RepID=UPI002FEFE92D
MLILLPPSEGKSAGSGAPLAPDRLGLPALRPAREAVLTALVDLCAGTDPETARTTLGLSPGQQGEVARNAGLRSAPTAPAAEVYTGVLYAALDVGTLPPTAAALAESSVLVSSGLWGAVRLADPIPAYRCAIGVSLPGIGPLTGHWRRVLAPVLTETAGDGPVLDLRSGAYAATWRPRGAVAGRTATVRVLHEREVAGRVTRTVVSHFNKATKGRLVRDLLTSGARPTTVTELADALRDLKYRLVDQPSPPGQPVRLDVVVTEL